MQCVFPQLPQARDAADPRTFTPGEEVCLRNDAAGRTRGRYTSAHPQPGTGLVFTHIIDDRWITWWNVGKLEPAPVSPTLAEFVGRNVKTSLRIPLGRGVVSYPTRVGLPQDVVNEIKKYGGKTRRARKGRKTSQRRPPRSRRTR